MASSDATQRAVLAGLSCGIGLAAPVVMYAATLPFSSVNETVVAGAVPFAVGAVAGVASTQPRWAFPSIVPSTMAACLSPMPWAAPLSLAGPTTSSRPLDSRTAAGGGASACGSG